MKRRLTQLAFVLAALLLFGAESKAGPIRLAFRDTTLVGGTTFDYAIYVDSSLTGLNVSSYQLEFTFNSSYFTFVSATAVGTMTETWGLLDANEISAGRIRVAGSGSSVLSGTGKLVIVRFAAKVLTFNVSGGFTFQSSTLNEGDPLTTHRNGTVTVNRPPFITVSPDTWTMTRGETKLFAASGGTGPYTWSVTNPGVASIDASGLLSALNPGLTKVVAEDAVGTIDTSGIVEIRGLKLSVRDTTRYQGQTLDLPIYATDVNGLGITSGQLAVTYNQNLWTATGIEQAGSMLASFAVPEFAVTPGKIAISFAGSTALSGSGILMYVRLQATSSTYGGSTINFQNVLFNEDILATTVAGTATVQQLSPINVSPGGTQTLVKGDSIQFGASGGTGPYTWSVSDSQRAMISSAGLLKVKRGGSVIVSATDALGSKGSSGTVNLYDFRVSVPDVSYLVANPADTSVEIPIMVTGNDTGFTAFQFRLTYTTGYFLTLDTVITGGTLASSWTLVPGYSSGSARLAAAGTAGIMSGGTLVRLRFQVPVSTPKPSTTSLSLSEVLFNEGSPIPLIDNGYVTIRSTNAKPFLSTRSPSSLDSVGLNLPALFSVSVFDSDGDPLTYSWIVNGVVEQSGGGNSFSRTFTSVSPTENVKVIFADPYGSKDSTSWTFKVVTGVEDWYEINPETFFLGQNYPNPFNPSTVIRYGLPMRSTVRLEVYDILGKRIATLVDGEQEARYYEVRWEANVATGIYLYKIEAVGVDDHSLRFVQVRKMLLLR